LRTSLLLLLCSFLNISFAETSPRIYYLIDHSGRQQLKDVRSSIEWKLLPDHNADFGFTKDECAWLMMVCKSKKPNRKQMINLANASLDSVDFYNGCRHYQAGDRVAFWDFSTPEPSFEVLSDTSFFRVKKYNSFLKIPIRIVEKKTFERKMDRYLIIVSVAMGIFMVFFLFNFTLYLIRHEQLFGLFSLHILLIILYYLLSNGFLKTYLFPSFIYMSELRLYVASISPLPFYWFLSHLLNLREHQPNLSRLARYVSMAVSILVAISFIFFEWISQHMAYPFIVSIYLCNGLLMLVLFLQSIQTIRVGERNKKWISTIFLCNASLTILLLTAESQVLKIYPDFDLLLCMSSLEVVVFGVLIAVNFFRTFYHNEQLALRLLKEREHANKSFAKGEIRERKRIARVLHDYYQSKLTALRLMYINQQDASYIENEMLQLERDLRQFSHQLMPRELESGELIPALRSVLKNFERTQNGWTVEIFTYDISERVSEDWVYDVFLIVHECLQNSMKHSGGNHVILECYDHDSFYTFSYRDNGCGVQSDANIDSNGLGIIGIRERVLHYSGSISFDTEDSTGFQVTMNLPKGIQNNTIPIDGY
jgi:signal transduction histidine kinase